MSSLTLESTRKEEVVFPDTISNSEMIESNSPKTSWCWKYVQGYLEPIGRLFRNTFFLPLYNKKVDVERTLNQRLAEKISLDLQNSEAFCSKELSIIRRCFSMRDIDVRLEGPVTKIFTLRLFESKMPIGGKKLRVILFCFNGNRECSGGTTLSTQAWNPLKIQELSKIPLSILRAFQTTGIRVDSLVTNSLGNVILDALSTEPICATTIPPTLIINRGYTSTKKVANRFFIFPLNYILYGVAKLCGWSADPEKGLLTFLEKNHQKHIHSPQKVVIIEARKDYFFSEEGSFDPNIHEKIAKLGVSVFRAKFWPYPFQSRSHHALCLDHFVNNSETQLLANNMSFSLNEGEKMSSAIARNIFFEGDEEWHTSFFIGGADATREIGTVRETMPLLSAFIEEGERRDVCDPRDKKGMMKAAS